MQRWAVWLKRLWRSVGNCGKRASMQPLMNARFVCPLDTECLDALAAEHQWIVTMEENVLKGGFGEACGDYILEKHEDIRLIHIGVPDVYVEHGGVDQLKKTLHMNADSIVERICMEMDGE